MYAFEILSLTLMEKHRLRAFQNRVLRKIFRPKRVEVTEEWRRLHNVKLYNLYNLPNIISVLSQEE
jgi:hypothetical protein